MLQDTPLIYSIVFGYMASAFPAIISYAQEMLPNKLGMVSGLFYGFAFGVAAIGSAIIGVMADYKSIYFVYQICSFLPLLGVVCFFIPTMNTKKNKLIPSPV